MPSSRCLRPALIAVAISVAVFSTLATADPLPEQHETLTEDQIVKTLHALCENIPKSKKPQSDSIIVESVQRLFPLLTGDLKDPGAYVSPDVFLSDSAPSSSRIASMLSLRSRKEKSVSSDDKSKDRVQFVRNLIAMERGDGRKLAFAAVLTSLMPSPDLRAVFKDPDTLLLLLLERTQLSKPSWPLAGLFRCIADRMTPEALQERKEAALDLIYEIYLTPLLQSAPPSFESEPIRLFHSVSLSSTPEAVERLARKISVQWEGKSDLIALIFAPYIYQKLSPSLSAQRSIFSVKNLLEEKAKAWAPQLRWEDLLIQLVLCSDVSIPDLALLLLETPVAGSSLRLSSQGDLKHAKHHHFQLLETFMSRCRQHFDSDAFLLRALRHCALIGILDQLVPIMGACMDGLQPRTCYFVILGAPSVVDHIPDPGRLLDRAAGLRMNDEFPFGSRFKRDMTDAEFNAHLLKVAQTRAEHNRCFKESLVQLLFRHTVKDALCAKIIASPLWHPTPSNMALLDSALMKELAPGSYDADKMRALLARQDVLALLPPESAASLSLNLVRVLQRLHTGAPLSDWIEIIQSPQWTPSIINLNQLRLEVIAGTVTGSVCSELIQALLNRCGHAQKSPKRASSSVQLCDLLLELYLRSPSTDYITLIRDLPLTHTQWSTIINKELWHPSAHHMAALNTLLSMDSKPDQAFTNMIWTLLNRMDIPDVLNGNDGAELRRLLLALMERSLGLDFVQLLKHENWPSSLWQNVVKDQRWTLTMDNLTALREQVSKDSGPLSVCGDVLKEMLNRHDVKTMLNDWEQSKQLRYLLIWLYHRMIASRSDLLKNPFTDWSPDTSWTMLFSDKGWMPSESNLSLLKKLIEAHRIAYPKDVIRTLFDRDDIQNLLKSNNNDSQLLRDVLLNLYQSAPAPDWSLLFELPYWSPSVWRLLIGKPGWNPSPKCLDALRKSIPANSVTDSGWIEVMEALLERTDIQQRLQGEGSANESSLKDLLSSLYRHLPDGQAEALCHKYPVYSNLFPARSSSASSLPRH